MDTEKEPYIKPDQKVTELTIRAVILGAILSIVLSAANAYFGLFAGMTVSASIPAAVISMAILRAFKNSSILENNLVQTAASAGESLAAGVIFTIPALILMGYWEDFNYTETTLIALAGGILGILFTIPLRKALIVKEKLKFPEGIATSEVLKTGESEGGFIKYLVYGGLIGGLFKLSEGAMKLWTGVFEKGTILKGKAFLYFGINLSPALVAVGYIVGLNIAFLIFLGGAISWYLAIPIHIYLFGAPEGVSAVDAGYSVWNSQIRYLGVGAMIVGGFWALISIRSSLKTAFQSGVEAFRKSKSSLSETARTNLDTPMSWVIIGIGVMIVPIFLIYLSEIENVGITAFMAIIMVIAGFLFSSVAGYMAGLVGSSNNPISGVTIATILSAALLLAALMGTEDAARGAAGAILIGAVVCCAAAIAGDNMQDLKAGHMLGSTPYKQQIMQVVGVIAGAVAIAPVLSYLLEAYGIGPATDANPDSLTAPQAALMQSVATGIFGGDLPWNMVTIGGIIGAIIIAIDQYLAKINANFRMPVLAVAVGIYLPFELDSAIFVGGVIAWIIERYYSKQAKNANNTEQHEIAKDRSSKAGLLIASGLITGEALMGIMIAFLIVFNYAKKIKVFETPMWESIPGLILFIFIIYFLIHIMKKVYKQK
ncbi:OPT family oligopeptide transporter [Chondrinema litorale]|uniref:OPT family oligopeptide transporter n=1 Tax=Chondrinema litorale TaxID=2994555 RepID=UPI002544A984|nr:oligopeptide transporter, OPT family [Chondrinema litorale]UZR94404.1 oligopeptide transporter, OPT family [Chondrinema litorale]